MVSKLSPTGTTTLEYLERFPTTSKKTLARKMYKENPQLFNSLEHARTSIRNHAGQNGNKNRAEITPRRFIRDELVPSGENPFNFPGSDALTYPIFKLPNASNRIAILPDLHVPYHSVEALTCALRWCKEHDINTFFLSEWLDCHSLSRWVRDPRKRRFTEEREILWHILDIVQNEFPNAVFYYRSGNHEARYEDYMKTHAPELFDVSDFEFDVLMKFGERGIHYIGDKIRVQMGKLFSLHGHEFARAMIGPVNPARGLFLRTKQSAICEHHHQTSEHSEPMLNGDVITCWSIGCLSELNPEYMPLNKWNHGFARVLVNPDDTFKVTNLRIFEGKML